MKFKVDIQNPEDFSDIPTIFELQRWVETALYKHRDSAEVTIRFVSKQESQKLNKDFRQKDKPTNVLSFPSQAPEIQALSYPFLGDLVICREIVIDEAIQSNKLLKAHYAHMIVHGILHLLGYDHIDEKDAAFMEPIEVKILSKLGFDNPYEV